MTAPAPAPPPAVVSYIARPSAGAAGHAIVCTVRADGSDPGRALRPSGDFRDASWSPDGRRVAVVTWIGTQAWAETMRWDGRNRRSIGRGQALPFSVAAPAWSPNGRALAFTLGGSLYVARPDGSRRRRLVRGAGAIAGYALDPTWSADGRRIFYSFGHVGPVDFRLYSIRPDGTDRRLECDDVGAEWSPDRREIALVRYPGAQLYVSRPDGSGQRQVTHDEPFVVESPSWSPDGSALAFLLRAPTAGPRPAPADLAVASSDGSGEVRLTKTPSLDESAPSWRREAGPSFGPCITPP